MPTHYERIKELIDLLNVHNSDTKQISKQDQNVQDVDKASKANFTSSTPYDQSKLYKPTPPKR